MTEASSGVASLIARIKQDGIQAAEAERTARLAAVTRDADEVIAAARRQADAILAEAQDAAARRRTQLDAELRMAARDFLFAFQERLSSQVIQPAADAAAAAALARPEAQAELVLELLRGSFQGAQVSVEPKLRAAFAAAVAAKASAEGLEIVDEAGLGGFRLRRAGEHFVWDVSKEAVARELARLVEPGLRAALSLKDA